MIEVSKVHYDVIAITEKKVQLNITQAVEGLGWEEEEDELAMKITFELYNAKYNGSRLSSLIKIGCVVAIKAYWGSGKGIVAMGNVTECERSTTKADEVFNVVAYDNLYSMQRSQDNIYFAAGKGTKSALTEVFKNWGITLSSYSGPDVSHAKILYKNSYLGDVVRGILDEAKKKGGGKAIVRSTKNKVSIVAVGGNKDIYHFEGNNSVSSKHKVSIANLVTRVKIVSSEKTDGLPKVEAVKNGKTEYGIFQRIVNHASSDNLSEAQETAQEMLDENGKPKETATVQAPDTPPVRKGDMVHLAVGALNGFYIVKSVQHDADSGKMTMQVEKADTTAKKKTTKAKKKTYKVGDVVNFHGGKHYISSYPGAKGYNVSAGRAKITITNGSGKAHPWHLVYENWSETHVYGWVDDGSFD